MVKMGVTSVGADPYTITLNAASSGFQSFADAYGANATVDILITQGTVWEVARDCTYTHSGTTVTRGTFEDSSTGSRITTFDNTAVVSVVATAAFGNATENFLGAWGALSGENSITGAATAVIGRLNVCSGTSANYTVTLPAVSGNAGKYIGFQMAPGLTKLVTLDGNSTETIDGATTRIMWAQETALLYCDGTTWTKMAGKTIPFQVTIKRTTDQTGITTQTWTAVALTTVEAGTSLMHDSTNNRVKIVRPGLYSATGQVVLTWSGSNTEAYASIEKNSTSQTTGQIIYTGRTAAQFRCPFTTQQCAVDDYISMNIWLDGSSGTIVGANIPTLGVCEVVTW